MEAADIVRSGLFARQQRHRKTGRRFLVAIHIPDKQAYWAPAPQGASNRMRLKLCAVLILGVIAAGPAAAQAKSNQTEVNKKLVLDFFRLVFEAENADAAKDFLAEDYIQHNPTVPTGREGFINTFKSMFHGPKPVQPTLRRQPVAVVAEGDLVTVIWKRPLPDPADPSKTYDAFAFDLFRIQNGKLMEHWDGATK